MPHKKEHDLDSLLSSRARAAVEHALRSGGEVAKDEIDTLDRLARLAELQRVTAPPERRRRWPVIGLAVATLAMVSLLLFARVPQTEIELDVQVTEVGFLLDARQVLLENVALRQVGASGLSGVQLPEPTDALLAGTDRDGDESVIRVSAGRGDAEGSINMGAIVPQAGTEVWLRQGENPNQYRLSLRDPRDPIQIDVAGSVAISLAGVPPRVHLFETPGGIVLRPGTGVVSLDMVLLDQKRAGITSHMSASGLNFSRVDEISDRSLALVRRLSTIVSGTLYLESLNDQRRQLRAGEDLQFSQAKGTIRMIRVEPEHLSLNFHGWVRGMRTDADNLMPTWLDWLKAQHSVSLFWGTAVYLFGLGLAGVKWVKGAL